MSHDDTDSMARGEQPALSALFVGVAANKDSLARIVRLFLVIWDDDQGICLPMMWDGDCEGAICGGAVRKTDRVAIFTSRKAARKAIDISTKWNALRKAQGHIYNSDFEGDCRKCLRVVECLPNDQALPQAGHTKP